RQRSFVCLTPHLTISRAIMTIIIPSHYAV
ncbi:glutathione S-transferase, N-terminal domain protein, partial [Vibrio parahaemolyticus V-223/04]